MADPSRVLVAGDWHGNTDWATGVIERLPELLPNEDRRIVLHAGDFGIWPGRHGQTYLASVDRALGSVNAELWFVDGNHEWNDDIAQQVAVCGRERRIQQSGRTRGPWNCWLLPRGHRWSWHGRSWLALGGATSVDRAVRTPGRDWWPEEKLSTADQQAAIAPGQVDVVLAHDCPVSVPLNLPRPAPGWWDVRTADAHRGVVQAIADIVRPSWWIHGHYHLAHQATVAMGHGDVEVTGLASDAEVHGNYRVLDVTSMTWAAS